MILIENHGEEWKVYTYTKGHVELVATASAIALSNPTFVGDKIIGEPHAGYGIQFIKPNDDLWRSLSLRLGKHMPGWLATKLYFKEGNLVVGKKIAKSADIVCAWGEHIAASGVKYVEYNPALQVHSALN